MKLIGFLSNGYPTLEDSRKRAYHYVENGIDIIEAEFPAADPYLDNDLLKKRIAIARQQTTNYDDYMNSILEIKRNLPNTEIMINIYEDTILEIGYEKFMKFMNKLGTNKLLLAGKRFPEVRKTLVENGYYASSFVTREVLDEDLKIAEKSNGFIYLQGFGDESLYNKKYPTLKSCVEVVRPLIQDRNIYCGIGVHTVEQIKEVYKAGADGVFLGSILIKEEDNIKKQAELIRTLRKIADGELK